MGQDCSQRFKVKQTEIWNPADALKAFEAYEKRMAVLASLPVKPVDDQSDLNMFTHYEEQLNIRNVHLIEFEDRLKRFVFKVKDSGDKANASEVTTIRKRQLQIAFEGNPYLEAMINDKKSLDWRLLMQDNIFVVYKDEEDHYREEESFEEDDQLTFRVDELNLFGILYCKCEPEVRTERFYAFLQPGLEEQISNSDRDLEVFVPLMGRICYEAVINCFNREHEAQGSNKAQPDLIPDNDQVALLDEACKEVLIDEDIGFIEKVFGFQTRQSAAVFKLKMKKDCFHFLQPHSIRSMVKQQLNEKLVNAQDTY